ncbi:S-layer domain protein, partial [mine drainage metagenome]
QSGTLTAPLSKAGTYAVLVNTTKFNDVPSNFWAKGAIDLLLGRNAISGFADGGFHPNATVTRAQFVKMLVLSLGLTVPAQPTSAGFSDVPATAWFAPYVDSAVQAGLVQGINATTFGPSELITREQLAVMVARAMGTYQPSSPQQVAFK